MATKEKSTTALVAAEPMGIVAWMAAQYGMDARRFEQTLRATIMPSATTPEEFAAFLLVAKRYGLNPLVKEIYAFPDKKGGIQPVVSIDGWLRIINDHAQMDGMEFVDREDESGALVAISCAIYRKDRSHPTSVTEYMAECKMGTQPWKQWPARMLRHKATIQAGRYAFGFSGIIDPDEAERMALAQAAQPVAKGAVEALKARLTPPVTTASGLDDDPPPIPASAVLDSPFERDLPLPGFIDPSDNPEAGAEAKA